MTYEEKKLNEIIRREGLSGEIKESAKFFKDPLPLAFERKAQFAKAAMQLKSKFNVDKGYIERVVDEINALLKPPTVGQGKKGYSSSRDFIGKRFGNFTVVRLVDDNLPIEKTHAILQCGQCGKNKQYSLKHVRSNPRKLFCSCGANNRNI